MLKQSLLTTTILSFLLLFAGCTTKPGDEVLPTVAPTVTPTAASPTVTPTNVESTPVATPTETPLLPVFSAESGFYDEEFSLTLSSGPEYTIYYTTDGSDPRSSDSTFLYTSELLIFDNTNHANVYSAITDISLTGYRPPEHKIDKGIIIRAVAKNADGTYGPVVTNSYFVGKDASYYKDMRVISMVTDENYLFNPDTGAYMIGSNYYEWLYSKDSWYMDPMDVNNPTNYNADGKESEFPVTIQILDRGMPVYTIAVGARIAGNWTRANAQKSFRLYARKEYGASKMKYTFFDGLTDINGNPIEKFDKVTLWAGGNDHILHFRDAFIQDIAKECDIDYMAAEPCILFINGEFWGFYLLREKTDGYYIQSHYGIDEKNVTVIKNGVLEDGTEEALEEYRSFCRWVSSSDMSKKEIYQKFCEQIDVQSFMDYIAIETYVNNSDWANGYLNNWIVWRSEVIDPDIPRADGKWRFILYDLDITSGIYGSEINSYTYDSLNKIHATNHDFSFPDMLQSLRKNEEFLNAFYDNYLSVVDNCFAVEKVGIKLTAYMNACQEATKATHYRFGNNWAAESYEEEAQNLLTYFKHRPHYAKYYLDLFCKRDAREAMKRLPSD